jgi:RNA polymerase sigma-70 factor (ECF subfamily)
VAQRAATGPDGADLWGYHGEVRAVARRVLRDAVEAEDVSQEALLRALSSSVPIDEAGRGAWLTVVGRRLAIDTAKQQQRVEHVAEPLDQVATDCDPAVLAEHRELLAQVWQAVGRLNNRQQRLLLGQVVAGLSLDQLAAEEETTVASVRSVLARARESVRGFLHDTGWLAAGGAHRLFSTMQESLQRVAPRLPRETGDALGAVAAAVALLFGSSAVGGPSGPTDEPATAVVAAAPSSIDSGGTDRSLLGDELPTSGFDALLGDLHDLPAVTEDEGWQVIPFAPTEGEIVQFAVSPDQQTVLAHGGYAETAESAEQEQLVKEWEPTLYRSDDGGRHWRRIRQSGFVPGRVLFAPRWPDDPRIFVVTDNGVIQSIDGGNTFQSFQHVSTGEPTTTVGAIQEEAQQDPRTRLRSEQRPSPVSLRPAVLSPRFAEGDERLFLGGNGRAKAEAFDVKLGVAEPLVSAPPWSSSRGVAPASDYAASEAVLIGATATDGAAHQRGALFRCAQRRCEEVHRFADISEAPGVFTSPGHPGLVYVWTTYAAYRSTDGGHTWQRQVLGPVVDVIEVGDRFVFLSLSGIPVSDDHGATWRQLRILYSISAVAPIGREGLLLAAGPGMACSPDRGESWLPACA